MVAVEREAAADGAVAWVVVQSLKLGQMSFARISFFSNVLGKILRRLVALNAERAQEEKRGLIRWLRPEFQNPGGAGTAQGALSLADAGMAPNAKKAQKLSWPKTLAEQAQAVRAALGARARPSTAADIAKTFKNAKLERVGELLEALASLGQARAVGGDRFAA